MPVWAKPFSFNRPIHRNLAGPSLQSTMAEAGTLDLRPGCRGFLRAISWFCLRWFFILGLSKRPFIPSQNHSKTIHKNIPFNSIWKTFQENTTKHPLQKALWNPLLLAKTTSRNNCSINSFRRKTTTLRKNTLTKKNRFKQLPNPATPSVPFQRRRRKAQIFRAKPTDHAADVIAARGQREAVSEQRAVFLFL